MYEKELQDTIDHYKRIFDWVIRTQQGNDTPNSLEMFRSIGEDWFGNSCELCKPFTVYRINCEGCPVQVAYGKCSYVKDSINWWVSIVKSKTWEDWLISTHMFIVQLEALRK